MKSKIGKGEWFAIIAIATVIDIIQIFFLEAILAWLGGVGVVINEALDPIIAGITVLYLQMRGVEIIRNPKRLIWLVATEASAELSGGLLQFWFGTLIFIYVDVKKEELAAKVMNKVPFSGALNQDGVRRPPTPPPLNERNIRLPRKNNIIKTDFGDTTDEDNSIAA